MASIITIEFNDVPLEDGFLRLLNPDYLGLNGLETFRDKRLNSYETRIALPGVEQLRECAENFANAFQIDYNASGVFFINTNNSTVTISTEQNGVFDGFTRDNLAYSINIFVSNTPQNITFEVTSITYLEPLTNPCGKVLVRIEANKVIQQVFSPVQISGNTETFVEFELDRGINWEYQVRSGLEGDSNPAQFQRTPAAIEENLLQFTTQATPNGVVLTINYVGNLANNRLLYSLNGVDFQTSNSFSNLLSDTYTVYVKDNYNCVKNATYVIGDFEPGQNSAPPFFYYPLANPILMFDNIEVDENTPYERLPNQLELNSVNYAIPHKYKPNEIVTIQFRTSYVPELATLKECGSLNSFIYVISKKTNNINAFDSRDAVKYIDSDGFVRLYFTTGNTYDLNGQVIPDGTHFLNGNYPNGYEQGGYVKFEGRYELIDAIVYNDDFERWEIVTLENPLNSIVDTPVIASIYYNIQDYEIYEISMAMPSEGIYTLEIDAIYNQQRINLISQKIEVSNEIEPHHRIEYANFENNELVFATGFVGTIRIPYDVLPKIVAADEIEDYQSEDRLIPLESYNRERFEFSFLAQTTNVIRQLNEVFKNSTIFIDGLEYKKVGTPDIRAIGASNGYFYKITMQRQNANRHIATDYDTQLSSGGFAYVGGSYLTSGGFLLNSNGLVINP